MKKFFKYFTITLVSFFITGFTLSCVTTWLVSRRPDCNDVLEKMLTKVIDENQCFQVSVPLYARSAADKPISGGVMLVCAFEKLFFGNYAEEDPSLLEDIPGKSIEKLGECKMSSEDRDIPYSILLFHLPTKARLTEESPNQGKE